MDGTTLRTGAVGALKGYLHPVSVAREIMRRLPHEFLVGEGAARFAHEIGAPTADNLIEDSKRVWREWFDRTLTPDAETGLARHPARGIMPPRDRSGDRRDTTVFLAHDMGGHIVRAPARPAGAGNIPAVWATARSSAPGPMPIRGMARPPAPARAK